MGDVLSKNQGVRGEYRWLETWAYPLSVKQVVTACPGIVQGRRVVITAWDAGPLPVAKDETERGWTRMKSLAVSPVVNDVTQLPDTDLYDEWYVFDNVPPIDSIHIFVTYTYSFQLSDRRDSSENAEGLRDRFWGQIEALHPLSYLAGNENAFLYACRGADLFDRVTETCRRLITGMPPRFSTD
jgi:hypothetical protein